VVLPWQEINAHQGACGHSASIQIVYWQQARILAGPNDRVEQGRLAANPSTSSIRYRRRGKCKDLSLYDIVGISSVWYRLRTFNAPRLPGQKEALLRGSAHLYLWGTDPGPIANVVGAAPGAAPKTKPSPQTIVAQMLRSLPDQLKDQMLLCCCLHCCQMRLLCLASLLCLLPGEPKLAHALVSFIAVFEATTICIAPPILTRTLQKVRKVRPFMLLRAAHLAGEGA